MRVKRFTGDSIGDTMNKIKKELGSEAVILQTRQIKEGGFLGFFTRTKVEITAAIEERLLNTTASTDQQTKSNNNSYINKAYEAYREKENEYAKAKVTSDTLLEDTQNEIKQMHNILKEIKGQMTKGQQELFPEPLEKWVSFLKQRGISSEIAYELMTIIKSQINEEQSQDPDIIYTKLQTQIFSLCSHTDTIKPRKLKTLVIALVGPTGVGKTTTIGKLAAGFSIIDKKKVALITADTYRVAAVEQLRTFGEIIGVPVEVVMNPEGLKEALERHWDKELVFIDTAGRSPHHDLHMSELEAFINAAEPDLTMLVMSVTTNNSDQMMVYERFKKLSTHLILTKLDESHSLGSMLDILVRTNLPVAYLTNGQNVPDDIDAATPQKLVRYILGEVSPNV